MKSVKVAAAPVRWNVVRVVMLRLCKVNVLERVPRISLLMVQKEYARYMRLFA